MNSHELKECDPGVIELVLTAATKVHSGLGPGLLESVYDAALAFELARAGLNFRRQVEVPVVYAGHDLGLGFRADFVVADSLLLELKSVEALAPVHLAQVITYLRLLQFKRGYLLNFNHPLMKQGIRRVSI